MLIGILDTGLDVNHEAFANAPAVQKLQKSSLSKLLYQISQGEDGKPTSPPTAMPPSGMPRSTAPAPWCC